MNTAVAALLALAVGILIGLLVARWTGRERAAVVEDFQTPTPVVPEGVAEVLAVLPSSGVLVGPHDEVLEATSTARNLGLARGRRLALPDLLELVRATRRDGQIRTVDLEVSRGPRAASTYLTARVAPLGSEQVLILADDQTTARRIEQTRRDFVANVSHELKTPVGAISLLAEAVEDAADDPTAVRRFAGRMGVESVRLNDLVAQIIDLSRLQADDPLADAEEVDVDAVLSDAVDRCRVDAESHQVSLAVAGVRGARVLGNARQLSVAVGNLVENAVVYSDPGARVVVAAHIQALTDDDYVEITVSDNGIGIPASEVGRIFERFYRVDYARSRANGGTGLGLAIVKHIAATHGGHVSVWSQPGAGSTFTITIPAHLQLPSQLSRTQEPPHSVTALPGADRQPDAADAAGSTNDRQEVR